MALTLYGAAPGASVGAGFLWRMSTDGYTIPDACGEEFNRFAQPETPAIPQVNDLAVEIADLAVGVYPIEGLEETALEATTGVSCVAEPSE